MPIPCHADLALYSCDVTSRFKKLTEAFKAQYGVLPELFARAPGRVNLIGEHIDYCNYGVLPMAITLDTVVAIARGGTKITVANLEPDKYATLEFDTDPEQLVDTDKHAWANYFMAAYKGVFEAMAARGLPRPEPVGLQVMVHGVVPTGAGLSSSAAFICSSSLALLAVYGALGSFQRHEVAQFAAKAEHYVGVQSGGMDQAISMLGMQGVAQHVEFNPVRASEVVLPEGATFVVADSLAVSNKADGAHTRYNMRVVECRLATALLAVALGASRSEAVQFKTLRDLEPLVEKRYGSSGATAEAVREHLHEERYTQEEVEGLLGQPLLEVLTTYAAVPQVLGAAGALGGFRLRQRALHVYEEAARVLEFKAVCESTLGSDEKLAALGKLMDASHHSCADLYECSCPELQQLTSLARSAGALGSRLTGAGWGGCTVSLVRDDQVDAFIATLREQYYQAKVAAGLTTEAKLGECLFASKPSSGAAVLRDLKLGEPL